MGRNEFRFEFDRNNAAQSARWLLVVMAMVAVVVTTAKSAYRVDLNEQAVVLRFGEYQATTEPGLHFLIPFVDEAIVVDMRERTLRLPFGVEGGREDIGRFSEEEALMLTADLNAAAVEWSVQYKVADPAKYLFSFHDDWIEQDVYLRGILKYVGRTVMNRLVGDYSFDEILTEKRTEVGGLARTATQEVLDRYDCGLIITAVQMQRVTPPEQVKASFAAVNEAVQQRDRYINEAGKERNTLIPKANADRDKAIREAEGYAARRRAEVKGEIDALRARYREFSEAPEETRLRLYLESMERVLSEAEDTTILDADLPQMLPLLNLNEGGR